MKKLLIYLFFYTISLSILPYTFSISASEDVNVMISEFLPDPLGSDTGKEWIELYNHSNNDINIESWKVKNTSSSGTVRNTNITNAIIRSKSYLVLTDSNLVQSPIQHVLTTGSINLFNINSKLELINQNGVTLEILEYTNSTEDRSWERKGKYCNDLLKHPTSNSIGAINLNNDLSCWPNIPISYPEVQVPVVSNPLPISYPQLSSNLPASFPNNNPQTNDDIAKENQLNQEIQNLDSIIITEIYSSPISGSKEWIEIYNQSGTSQRLEDYSIKEINSSGNFINSFQLKGEIFSLSYTAFEDLKISLNNSGDTVALYYKDTKIDQVTFPSLSSSETYSRNFDINSVNLDYKLDWFITKNISKAKLNLKNITPFVNITAIKKLTNEQRLSTFGCLTLVNEGLPEYYAYLADDESGIKVKFKATDQLAQGTCLSLEGDLVLNTKDKYIAINSYSVASENTIFPSINLQNDSDFKLWEGKSVSFNGILITRKYSSSLLLENNLKMKYPDEFESDEYVTKDLVGIEGIIIKTNGIYYIYPSKVAKSSNIQGLAKEISSYPTASVNKGISNISEEESAPKIELWPIFLILWIAVILFIFRGHLFDKWIILKKFLKNKVKYLNVKNNKYFGKELFNRNFSPKVSKT